MQKLAINKYIHNYCNIVADVEVIIVFFVYQMMSLKCNNEKRWYVLRFQFVDPLSVHCDFNYMNGLKVLINFLVCVSNHNTGKNHL